MNSTMSMYCFTKLKEYTENHATIKIAMSLTIYCHNNLNKSSMTQTNSVLNNNL